MDIEVHSLAFRHRFVCISSLLRNDEGKLDDDGLNYPQASTRRLLTALKEGFAVSGKLRCFTQTGLRMPGVGRISCERVPFNIAFG